MNRIAHGDRLAIVANGHGPGMLAADSAADHGIALAELSAATKKALSGMLPPNMACSNPIDVHGDAPPTRIAAAVEAVLSDANVDAALVLHVPRPSLGATDAARAVADVARRSPKPVLAAWLGAVDRAEATGALEAGGVANFYTPENAIDAFSFLAAYRHHQEWLLEVRRRSRNRRRPISTRWSACAPMRSPRTAPYSPRWRRIRCCRRFRCRSHPRRRPTRCPKRSQRRVVWAIR
jgi:acetyltransferase